MNEHTHISNSQLLAAYAGNSLEKWQAIVGREVKHKTLGRGIITSVEKRSSGTFIFTVTFEDDSQDSRQYTREILCDERYFLDMPLPDDADGIELTRMRVLQEEQRKADSARVEAERHREEDRQRARQDTEATERHSSRRTSQSIPSTSAIAESDITFVEGQEYRRVDLHNWLGGQRQGGISTPKLHHVILLFTGEAGEQHGYSDGWKDGKFLYTGEGQQGDMEFVRGNAAIRDSSSDGRAIHLFAQVKKGYVRYVGQMVCTGYHYIVGHDTDEKKRQMIRFELTPVHSLRRA